MCLGESLGDFREKSSRIGKQMIGKQNPPSAHLHCPSLPFLKLIGQPLNTIFML